MAAAYSPRTGAVGTGRCRTASASDIEMLFDISRAYGRMVVPPSTHRRTHATPSRLRVARNGACSAGVRLRRLRGSEQQQLRKASRCSDAGRGPRPPARPATDRDRQRRQPLLGAPGVRQIGRLRGREAEGGRLRPGRAAVRLPRVRGGRPLGAPADRARLDHVRRGRRLRAHRADRPGRRHRPRHGRRPTAGPREHLDQRLRGRRLRGLPGREHRVAPARHVHLRAEGRERRCRRRSRDRDLQPGQHRRTRPERHPGGDAHGQQHERYPGARHHLRARRHAGGDPWSGDAGLRQHRARDQDDVQRARGAPGQEPGQRGHGGRASRLGDRGARHQRQRLRLGRDPRGRRADGEGEAVEHGALCVVGRGGVEPRRLDLLRRPRSLRRTSTGSPSTSTST